MATFFQSLLVLSDTRIRDICQEAHVSSRTYYRMKRFVPVKAECYEKLFIALCRAVSEEEFLEHWTIFGKLLFEACDDTEFFI